MIREQIPWETYGKRPPWRNTIWQTFPRKKSHGRISPRGEQYHMVKFPLYGKSPPPPHKFHDKGTNTMGDCPRGNYTIWQTFPMKEYHMANLPPGRNPMAELPPLWQISSNTNSICNIGTECAICFGRGGGEKSHRWGIFTIWYFIRGKEIHGGGGGGESHVTPDSPYSGNVMYPQQNNQFHTIIINHISLEICLHVSLPVNLHIASACKWVVNPVLSDWMRNRKAQIHAGWRVFKRWFQ